MIDGSIVSGSMKFLLICVCALIPLAILGIWKATEIIIWCCQHIHIG